MASTVPPSAAPAALQAPTRPINEGFRGFGDDGPTFLDVLDIINPLQHIPIVSTIYRAVTSDVLDPIPRLIGGALFGGLLGALSSLVNVVVQEVTGSDIGDHVLGFVDDLFAGSKGDFIARQHSVEPPFPVDETEMYIPAPPANAAAMASASRQYGASAALTAQRSHPGVDLLG